jgi:hypothetical protein
MEQAYWLGRKRASAAMARQATSAEARLAHLDLAGRYSVKAAAAGPEPLRLQLPSRSEESAYYDRLEAGARWLAAGTEAEERQAHLGMANHYAQLRREAGGEGRF